MRDEISSLVPRTREECGILNLNRRDQPGSHWVCWVKIERDRYYFDSYAEKPPPEVLKYLKTKNELKTDKPSIHCNASTVQKCGSKECGALCLYVIFNMLKNGQSFTAVIQNLEKRYASSNPKSPLRVALSASHC